MADLSVTAANVAMSSAGKTRTGTVGASTTITQGEVIYLDSGTGTLKLSSHDVDAATASAIGIALSGGTDGKRITYCYEDPEFTPGATIVSGTAYVVGAGDGTLAPAADIGTTDYATFMGSAISTTKMNLKIIVGGQRP